ncbi:hypothetical protein OZD63_01700, partial [Wolbachia endosymbiont of Drosophila leontia]|uniref:hypothetical protein n=1 Tax=Wolbachia endosymbiont of Drosophila leontia TaxID=3002580 RepID=UPI0023A9E027
QYWSNFFKLFFTYISWIAFLHRYTSFLTMLILPHIFEILNRFLERLLLFSVLCTSYLLIVQ